MTIQKQPLVTNLMDMSINNPGILTKFNPRPKIIPNLSVREIVQFHKILRLLVTHLFPEVINCFNKKTENMLRQLIPNRDLGIHKPTQVQSIEHNEAINLLHVHRICNYKSNCQEEAETHLPY